MKRFSIPIFLTLAVAAAGDLPAADLTLADALQLAAENNPTLIARRFGERAAEALIEQAGQRPNPTLDVEVENFLGTGQVQGVRSFESTVQASQTLERGGKLEKRVALARRARDTAVHEFAVQRAEILAETAVAYVEALAAGERLALAAEPLALAQETLAAANARVAEGAASPAESARARAGVASAQGELARAQSSLAAARASLAATWGGPPADVGPLPGRIRVSNELPAIETFRAALAQHPRRALQEAIVAARRASLDLEQAHAVQDITVGGGVRFLRAGTDATFVAGVSMPLPIRHRNQGNIRAARETLAGAEHGTHAVESELRVAFARAWQELQAAHAAAQNLRRDALPATAEAHTIVRQAYDEGQLPLIDVLDAQRALVDLHREILEAETAYAVALARVEGLAAPTFPATSALLSSE